MIRRPPRSTLFPTRRSSDLRVGAAVRPQAERDGTALPSEHGGVRSRGGRGDGGRASSDPLFRSEEHTSELQSQSNLVCRLLLEKKKRSSTRDTLRLRTIHSI